MHVHEPKSFQGAVRVPLMSSMPTENDTIALFTSTCARVCARAGSLMKLTVKSNCRAEGIYDLHERYFITKLLKLSTYSDSRTIKPLKWREEQPEPINQQHPSHTRSWYKQFGAFPGNTKPTLHFLFMADRDRK